MQTRLSSLAEACISTAIGFVISYLTLLVLSDLWNLNTTPADDLAITLIFTVISILRQYFVRRLFNWLGLRKQPILATKDDLLPPCPSFQYHFPKQPEPTEEQQLIQNTLADDGLNIPQARWQGKNADDKNLK